MPTNFSYAGKAARILTIQELLSGCPNAKDYEASNGEHSLKNCNFLFEGTKYTSSNNYSDSLLLENPISSISFDPNQSGKMVWMLDAEYSMLDGIMANSSIGLHPVIDVPKIRIQLKNLPACGEHEKVNSQETGCECVDGYVKVNETCQYKVTCGSNEDYVESDNSCTCKQGYVEINNQCVQKATCDTNATYNSSNNT